MIYIFILGNIFFSNLCLAKNPKQNLGEYYEYDTEGGKAKQASKKALSHSKKIIKTPFHISKHGAIKVTSLFRGIFKQVKDFIKHNHTDYRQNKTMINNALSGWQNLVLTDPSMTGVSKKEALIYFPHKIFNALQTNFIRLGVRLPMHILDGIRGTINGAVNGFLG